MSRREARRTGRREQTTVKRVFAVEFGFHCWYGWVPGPLHARVLTRRNIIPVLYYIKIVETVTESTPVERIWIFRERWEKR